MPVYSVDVCHSTSGTTGYLNAQRSSGSRATRRRQGLRFVGSSWHDDLVAFDHRGQLPPAARGTTARIVNSEHGGRRTSLPARSTAGDVANASATTRSYAAAAGNWATTTVTVRSLAGPSIAHATAKPQHAKDDADSCRHNR
jgi:hypothetical protein